MSKKLTVLVVVNNFLHSGGLTKNYFAIDAREVESEAVHLLPTLSDYFLHATKIPIETLKIELRNDIVRAPVGDIVYLIGISYKIE